MNTGYTFPINLKIIIVNTVLWEIHSTNGGGMIFGFQEFDSS